MLAYVSLSNDLAVKFEQRLAVKSIAWHLSRPFAKQRRSLRDGHFAT